MAETIRLELIKWLIPFCIAVITLTVNVYYNNKSLQRESVRLLETRIERLITERDKCDVDKNRYYQENIELMKKLFTRRTKTTPETREVQ